MENERIDMELLAPAGGFEQLKAAIDFGADAVYLAADKFGMRARAANFSMDDLSRAVDMAHDAGVKVHATVNVMMMQDDIGQLPDFLAQLQDARIDALIIGDAGAFMMAREYAPACELHVSTQASVSNSEAAKMWHALGASRIVCAREMTLSGIAKMRNELPSDLEIEAFVHGAQCMAISGRCLISSYLTERSGNRGHCTQPCRWEYTLEEEKRPGMHFPVEEDARGTYLMNAKDLRMIEHLHDLRDAGVDSVKIEGRNKKAFYVATVVGAYRRVLDGAPISEVLPELDAVSHRPYSTGFYFSNPQQACDYDGYEQETLHVADVVDCVEASGAVECFEGYSVFAKCRNRFAEGDVLEALVPHAPVKQVKVKDLHWIPESESGKAIPPQPVDVANRSCTIYTFSSDEFIPAGSFLRARTFRRSARSGA